MYVLFSTLEKVQEELKRQYKGVNGHKTITNDELDIQYSTTVGQIIICAVKEPGGVHISLLANDFLLSIQPRCSDPLFVSLPKWSMNIEHDKD